MTKRWQIRSQGMGIALLAVVFVVSGCVTETKTQSFSVVKDSKVQVSYIATDADFGKYRRLLGQDMGIFYPDGAPLSEEDLQKIRKIFRDAFLGELEGYDLVTEPGPNVLAVQASLIDMRSGTIEDVPNMRAGLGDLGQPGELVFLMELKDSQSDYVLGRAADSALAPSIATGGGRQTDWPAIESAAAHWATLFRQFLDQNLNQ